MSEFLPIPEDIDFLNYDVFHAHHMNGRLSRTTDYFKKEYRPHHASMRYYFGQSFRNLHHERQLVTHPMIFHKPLPISVGQRVVVFTPEQAYFQVMLKDKQTQSEVYSAAPTDLVFVGTLTKLETCGRKLYVELLLKQAQVCLHFKLINILPIIPTYFFTEKFQRNAPPTKICATTA